MEACVAFETPSCCVHKLREKKNHLFSVCLLVCHTGCSPLGGQLDLFSFSSTSVTLFNVLSLICSSCPPSTLPSVCVSSSSKPPPPPTVCCSQLHGKVTKQRSFLPRRAVGALGGDAARLGLVFVVVKQMSHSCVKHTNTVAGLR